MNKIVIFFILITLAVRSSSQEMRIYHGTGGQSTYFLENDNERNSRWGDSIVFIRPLNHKIEIVILNPNPFFYTYELKLDNFEIKDDLPDISNLLEAINAIPDIAQKSGNGSHVYPDETIDPRKKPTDFQKYQAMLKELSSEIKDMKNIIMQSDLPESKINALTSATPDKGFRSVLEGLNLKSSDKGHFNSTTLKEDLTEALKEAAKDPRIIQDITSESERNKAVESYIEAFSLLNVQIVETINQIKKMSASDPTIHYIIPVSEKNLKVRLIVKKKDDAKNTSRMEFDKVLCVIVPEYSRKSIELVPLVNLTYTSGIPEFGVQNGVITESIGEGYKFRAGVMLLYNYLHFGKYKEGAWGVGLGYTIPQKGVLENFQIGTMVSYKQVFRIGIGTGFSPYPAGLKDNLKAGNQLPTTIDNLEDIIDYKRKPSFFINFSFSGITILNK